MERQIFVILPVYNRKDITGRFLECLQKQTCKNYHLLLIDDGSTDGTAEMAEKMIDKITILKGDGSLWWGGSLQLAYRYFKKSSIFNKDDMVLIINDDVVIEKDFMETAIGIFDRNKERKVISQAIAVEHSTGERQLPGVFYDKKKLTFVQTEMLDKINCLSTRGLFLRMEDFLKSGGFHPVLLPHYFSDYEFTHRLISRKGFVPVFDRKLTVKFFPEFSGFITSIENVTFMDHLRRLFSKKNKSNPVHWIVFALLTAPFPYGIRNVCKIVYRNARELAVVGYRDVKRTLNQRRSR